jgi:uncharacterized protein YbaP (TraB family)
MYESKGGIMGIQGLLKRGRFQTLSIAFLIFLISFWTVANTHGQQTTKKNFLWSVKTDYSTIYLLGSVHLLRSDSYPLDKNIEDAYMDCKKVVFETDIGGMNTPAVQEHMTTLALYAGGQTLQQNISQETYHLLEKKAAEFGLSMAQLSHVRPWMCALTLTLLELQKMGFDPNYGIDQYFFNKAQQDKKTMVFLESIEYQINLFAGMDSYKEEAFLQQMLKELEVVKTMLDDIVSSWENGDATQLGSILHISFKDHPDIYNRFLAQRNKVWVGKIEDLIAYGDTALVIVGAGHLVGPDNLLQLLRNRGYTVEQIPAHAEIAALSPENLAHTLYIRSGMEEQIRNLPVAIQLGFDQERSQDDRIQQIPQDIYVNIKRLIAESFASSNLIAMVRRHMEAQMSQDEMQSVLSWLDSPFGKKCTQLFTTSLTLNALAEPQKFMTNDHHAPPSLTRLKLIQELASATKTLETVLEIAANTQLVVTTVITATLPDEQQRPFSEILDKINKNRPLLEQKVDQQITPLLLHMCRSLSDAELEQYITFARSNTGAQYYRSMFNGIKLALMDSSIRFGSSMEELEWERRQSGETL